MIKIQWDKSYDRGVHRMQRQQRSPSSKMQRDKKHILKEKTSAQNRDLNEE